MWARAMWARRQLLQGRDATPRHPDPLRWGHELEGYRVLGVVGQGSTAMVYRAVHRTTGAETAFKVWRHPVTCAAMGQFLRECRIHWALSGQPHITRLYTTSAPDAAVLWSAQELLDESLAERLRRPPRWDTPTTLAMAVQLTRAVETMHLAGILHRDINPRNVLVQGERLAVADFGTADYLQHPRQDRAAGSPRFVAPELFHGARPSPQTDLYSLATTINDMFPRVPTPAVAESLRLARAPDPRDRRTSVSRLRRVLEVELRPGEGGDARGL